MCIKDLWRKVKKEYKEVKENDNSKVKLEISQNSKNNPNYKKQRNKIINLMIFNLIVTLLCSTILYYIVNHMHELQYDFTAEQNSMNSTYILYVKNIIDARASSKLKDISHDIINTIQNDMDKEKLQRELSNGIVSKELDELFRSKIINECAVDGLDANKNNIFICNANGIIADYSEMYAAPENTKRTWDYEAQFQKNKGMYKYTINQLLNQDTSDFLVEERIVSNDEHIMLTSMSQDDLFEVFRVEGLEGIKNYTFLVPVYVMKNNDIFGVADIVNGQRVNNNKFIIVQRYSLYDYIKTYHLDAQVNVAIHYSFEHMFFMFYLFIIVYVSLSILNMLYSISIFNKSIIQEISVQNNNNNSNNDESFYTEINGMRFGGRRATDKYAAQILELVEQERERKSAEDNKET